jgi:hypothetical protein
VVGVLAELLNVPRVTSMSMRWPSRTTVTVTVSPGLWELMRPRSSSKPRIGVPSTATMRSPSLIPALAAAPPSVTLCT